MTAEQAPTALKHPALAEDLPADEGSFTYKQSDSLESSYTYIRKYNGY